MLTFDFICISAMAMERKTFSFLAESYLSVEVCSFGSAHLDGRFEHHPHGSGLDNREHFLLWTTTPSFNAIKTRLWSFSIYWRHRHLVYA